MPMSCASVRSSADQRKRKHPRKVSTSLPPAAANTATEAAPEADHVNRAALEVRCIYVAYYEWFIARYQRRRVRWLSHPRWEGGPYRGTVYRPIWPRIAAYIEALGLPYFEFIRHKFDLCSRTPPSPKGLLSDIGVPTLRQTIADCEHSLSIGLRNEQQFHAAVCHGAAAKLLLLDPSAGPLQWVMRDRRSNLFMYAAAVHANDQRYANCCREDAFRQYLKSPHAYQKVWGQWLPETVHFDALVYFGIPFPAFLRPAAGSLAPASEPENHVHA
jgi:hypothetical protein